MRRSSNRDEKTVRETIIASNGYTYKYTLSASRDKPSIYSLKVVMRALSGDIRSSTATLAMSDGGRAIAFYNKLVKNLATPSNLQYCVEDELCQ